LRIVTASADETARIWDAVASAKEIAILRGHEYGVTSATFSRDGSRIVTASADKTARIWNARLHTMSVKDLLLEACVRLVGMRKLTRDEMRLAGYSDSKPEIDVCNE
jgi:WD40 repeat protein